ncbi:cyclic nucleotide-binding domain-containing protein [Rhodohalobacter halophilus]|uniref:cyclic nucleotide-binding domain-containing protein n=1 Tax=Rhodohalobacter halophilus TaxID=1812810 RepID=UPI001FE1384A|nr:cyclic nucleotide-binding domain-containing protein [Rhodohalobacter halophilus]
MKQQSNIVKNSDLLKNLSPTERYELLQLCHRRTYKSGEYVYYQNDPASGLYFIEEGQIQLQVKNQGGIPNSENEETHTITVESPQEIGLVSIGYETRRLSSAQCLTDCTLLGFFTPDFETLKKRNPQTAVKFLEASSNRIMKQLDLSMQKIIELSDVKTAFQIQFETQYKSKAESD